jgi:hypothetical protein
MKYLIFFEKFNIQKEKPNIEIRSDMDTFNNSETNVKDFNSKKGQLLQIYLNYAEDSNPVEGTIPNDLYNKLLSGKFIKQGDKKNIIFTNPLFTKYAQYCRTKRDAKNTENNLQNASKNIDNIKSNIDTNTGDREVNNNQLKAEEENLNKSLKTLDNIKKDANKLQTGSKEDIKRTSKDLTDAKKRIEQNRNN